MSTRSEVRDRLLWQGNLENWDGLTTARANEMIQLAYDDAWNIIIAAHEDYAITVGGSFTLAGGSGGNTHALSSYTDFIKLRGVQRQFGGRWGDPLPTFEFDEMGSPGQLSYRLMNSTLYFEPQESAAGTYRIWYVQKQAALSGDSSVVQDPCGGAVEEFIIATVALKARIKDGASTSELERLRQEFAGKVRSAAANRHAGRPKQVSDARGALRRRLAHRTRSGIPPY